LGTNQPTRGFGHRPFPARRHATEPPAPGGAGGAEPSSHPAGADPEVEEALREIRLRLRAGGGANGASEADRARCALARIEADLSVTGRAWGLLPPLVSERRGAAARLELWVKRLVKRAAHWFTWEQVNFNAAVNDALLAAHALLSAQAKELEELRARVESLAESGREPEGLRAPAPRGPGAAQPEVRAGDGRAAAG
jgi:hypothetical protein